MPRILSKSVQRKSKKGVSWTQGARNKKLIGKFKEFERELEWINKEAFKN